MDKHSVAVNGCRVKVLSPNGRVASPYRIESGVLVKQCNEKHVFRAKQSIGIDESVWQRYRNTVQIVQFRLNGAIYEISSEDFARKSFVHGDGFALMPTRFVRLADLRLVREAPPHPHQLSLFEGA